MADFNINTRCTSNSHTFPQSQSTISFHCQQGCTLAFSPTDNCFGQASATANPDVTLNVVNTNPTTVTPTCNGLPATTGDAFDITFSGPIEGEKKAQY